MDGLSPFCMTLPHKRLDGRSLSHAPKKSLSQSPVLLDPMRWVMAHPSACHQKLESRKPYLTVSRLGVGRDASLAPGSCGSQWYLEFPKVFDSFLCA